MTFIPHGKHLIAGNWVGGEIKFTSEPAHGPAHDFFAGLPAHIDEAANAAENAFWSFGYSSRKDRAANASFRRITLKDLKDDLRHSAGLRKFT